MSYRPVPRTIEEIAESLAYVLRMVADFENKTQKFGPQQPPERFARNRHAIHYNTEAALYMYNNWKKENQPVDGQTGQTQQ